MLYHFQPSQTLYVIGSGPYAQELKSWIQHDGFQDVVLIPHQDFNLLPTNSQCMLGFQTIEYRKKFLDNYKINNYQWPAFVHSSAILATGVELNHGVVINPYTVVGYRAQLGQYNNIGIHCKVGHQTQLGHNVVVAPGTMIGGSTTIGNNVYFGQMCSVKDKIHIGDHMFFVMNSVISKNIHTSGRYAGNRRISTTVCPATS